MLEGLFDLHERLDKLDRVGDPLERLQAAVDWEHFRPALQTVRPPDDPGAAGRPSYDAVLLFKLLILQSLYNLSDEQLAYQMLDRLSFTRFLGLSLGARVPDATTIWRFRDALSKAGLAKKLFDAFDTFLRLNGFAARKGQIVDASIVEVPRQRNRRAENEQLKAGEDVAGWSAAKREQKDTDARWTKKHGVSYFGYKNHVNVDVRHKFIRDYAVTDASVHDSQVFECLLDETNSSRDAWADSAYRSKEKLAWLEAQGYREHVQRKGCRDRPLTKWERQGNRTRAKTRSRVEHVFGVMAQKAGTLLLRGVGIVRASCKIGLRNLAYNLDRYGLLAGLRS